MYSYFLGISLPLKAEAVFNHLKKNFHPHHRLTSPAHITLVSPFNWPNQTTLNGQLQKTAATFSPFLATFQKIGSFKQLKYGTVFLQPNKQEPFKALARTLQPIFNPEDLSKDYLAHLTLAQKVPHQNLNQVKHRLRQMHLQLDLQVKSLTLFQFDFDKKAWFAAQAFPFQSKQNQ